MNNEFFDRELRAILNALNTLQSNGAPLSQAAIDLYTMIDKKEQDTFNAKMKVTKTMRMTYQEYMSAVDLEIQRLSNGAISSHSDLRDSVFFMDLYYDDVPPEDTALEILQNDDLGAMILELDL